MDREQIEKWAREAIIFADTKRDWRKDGSWSEAFNEHFSSLAYNAGRAAALEEARKVLPQPPDEADIEEEGDYALGQSRGIRTCVDAITALIEKEPSNG